MAKIPREIFVTFFPATDKLEDVVTRRSNNYGRYHAKLLETEMQQIKCQKWHLEMSYDQKEKETNKKNDRHYLHINRGL